MTSRSACASTVDEGLELVGSSVATGGGEEARVLVAPALVDGMLDNDAVLLGVLSHPAKVLHAGEKAVEGADGAVEAAEREVERRAVVGLEHEKPDRVGRVLVEDLLERVEVPEALGHLLSVDHLASDPRRSI